MRLLDLFSGIGGFARGIEQAGVKIEEHYFSEIDKYAKAIYRRHYPEAIDLGPVGDVQGGRYEPFDLVTFGFPCQDLSVAGKRGGLSASRSGLFFEAMRIVKENRPKFFLWENVKGLLSINEGEDFEIVQEEMYKAGYLFDYELQNTAWVLPQNRERIYCIGVDIVWIGKQLIVDVHGGNSGKMILYERIIKGYLLSILQQNSRELKRPCEVESIGLVLDWLGTRKKGLSGLKLRSRFLKIMLGLDLPSFNNSYLDTLKQQLKPKGMCWDLLLDMLEASPLGDTSLKNQKANPGQCTESLWKNISEESSAELSRCIISILIKRITGLKTYTFAQIEAIIELYIIRLQALYPDLWKKALSDLTNELESMRYVENRRSEAKNKTEDDNASLSLFEAEGFRDEFIGHLAGECAGEIFPIGEDAENANEGIKRRNIGGAIYLIESHHRPNGERVRSTKRSPSIDNTPHYVIPITGQDIHGVLQGRDKRIRRLTPTECAGFQGFPDDWAATGIDADGREIEISDTQQYRCYGNAVTTRVVEEIIKKWAHPQEAK